MIRICFLMTLFTIVSCRNDDDLLPDCTDLDRPALSVSAYYAMGDSLFQTSEIVSYRVEGGSQIIYRTPDFVFRTNSRNARSVRWRIGTDPRDFAGQQTVSLNFNGLVDEIPLMVYGDPPNPTEPCERPNPEYRIDSSSTTVRLVRTDEPLEIEGVWVGSTTEFPNVVLEIGIARSSLAGRMVPSIRNFPTNDCRGLQSGNPIYTNIDQITRNRFFVQQASNYINHNDERCPSYEAYGELLSPNKLRVHFRYFSDPDTWFTFEGTRKG